ncbi:MULTISPECIES: TetR/AcrR family transcriptional regulator [Streptomyces]|uniref:TetR/AcrR family transcriptional regulator n=1 Tax=Streptomyces TaxID=1883 RepID=UPI0004CDB06D|nr:MULTISPECIES: TetR/AcrR family transcriptional regulator [Streptomyces]
MSSRGRAKQLLTEAADTVFYEHGIASTSVDAVVEAAGVSKPTLYAHFPTKSAVVAAGLRHRHATRKAELEEWAAREDDPRHRPLTVFRWLQDWYAERGRRGCAFLNAAVEAPQTDMTIRTPVQEEKTWLLTFLSRLCTEAGCGSPQELASQLLLLIDGVAGRVVVHGPEAAPQAAADAARAAAALIDASEPAR